MPSLCRDCLHHDATPFPDACPRCGGRRLVAHDELETLSIAHVDCDSFYASVEKRDRPELADKPLIVGHAGGRGVATTACYIARRYGARSAMPMYKCLELCPHAVVLPPDMPKYRRVAEEIRAIFAAVTDCVEPVSVDEAYLDMAPEHRRGDAGAAVLLADVALRVEQEIGLTVSVGLGPNKFLAKLASDMNKPRGFTVIGQAEARSVLAPLPVERIHGVGRALAGRLTAQGWTTIGHLQALGEMELTLRHGKLGRRLYHYARGLDERRVTPVRPAKSVSKETTFRRDLHRLADLEAELAGLTDSLAGALARKEVAGLTVVLKLKTSGFRTLTRNRRLPEATRRAEVILAAARLLLARELADSPGDSYRLIGVGLADLCPAEQADPPDLFAPGGEGRP
ncbi:DNA polymerase IV [Roseospirillum parvum]|nr:DNA polymerase IV [Roseospirillum parvum]